MERRAQAAESLIATSSGQAALDYAIQAADLYMRAAGEAATKRDATRLRLKCQQLITQAERLKAAITGHQPTQPPSLLQRTSRLHGNSFPPWSAEPTEKDFSLSSGDEPFTDESTFTLSPRQAATFGGWKRPRELYEDGGTDGWVFMNSENGCDLVQDMTTDCSVVASLCAAMRILTGRNSVLSSVLFPFDKAKGVPKFSPSGRYVLRLHFNGCFRRVVIDERLPASTTDRTLYVVDRRNPQLIWPALLEKAYLKVRGGYDFPGSNSGTDLWVLTGWIPEQLFLQREDLDIDSVWERIKAAHDSEDVVVTLGTGRISSEEEDVLGLIGEHDYAVMDLDVAGDSRRLLVKNPWCNGPVWRGSAYRASITDDSAIQPTDPEPANSLLAAGSFWMSLEDVVQHFESMYLNWNPGRFSQRQDHHFNWKMPSPKLASSLVHNPQYSLQSPKGGEVWILVSRHFMDAELEIARNRTDTMAAVSGQLGFMSILIFDNNGHRVQVSDGDLYRGPYVDSPQTLARLDASPMKRYIIVIDQHEFPLPEYTLTLSLFSQDPLRVKEAGDAMTHTKEITGSWTRRTAGGNSACTTYGTNPQFKLSLAQASPLSILLSTDIQDVHVHIDLVWAKGKRVQTLKARDITGSSGEYRRGCAVANITHVDAGVYTLVCSTFDAGQLADFALRISSMTPVTLEPVPADAAGRLRKTLTPFQLSDGEEVRRAQLSVSWLTRMSVTARSVIQTNLDPGSRPSSTLMVRLSVVHGWAPERTTIAVSGEGEYQELKSVVRTPELDMEPARLQREGMWLVVETMGTSQIGECIELELHSDAPVNIGRWELV
ncbi:cysteine protease [Fusarium falciforme]|uniref:Cysteine protease n=1 Tax=Fusarium falciforme TaxID=195108 RepID=A0A9W8RDM0_9HYPO|nr:cysteine protease [Fusarium falciforme]